jgi:hypothetical protein
MVITKLLSRHKSPPKLGAASTTETKVLTAVASKARKTAKQPYWASTRTGPPGRQRQATYR